MTEESIIQHFYVPSDNLKKIGLYLTNAGRRICKPDFHIESTDKNSYRMFFIISGKGSVSVKDKFQSIVKGDFIIKYPGEQLVLNSDDETTLEFMWLCFNGISCEKILSDIGLGNETTILNSIVNHSIQRAMNTVINALGMEDDINRLAATGETMILFSYIQQSLQRQFRIKDTYKQEAAISKVISFIEDNYSQDLNIQILCNYVNYSRSYLSRLFKKEVGMTIPEYSNTIRIQHARVLIRDSELSMREIAISVGFSDPYYFSKVFKGFTGLSPSAFRASFK